MLFFLAFSKVYETVFSFDSASQEKTVCPVSVPVSFRLTAGIIDTGSLPDALSSIKISAI